MGSYGQLRFLSGRAHFILFFILSPLPGRRPPTPTPFLFFYSPSFPSLPHALEPPVDAWLALAKMGN